MITRLYKGDIHGQRWIAHVPGDGWVMFPAKENGWELRQPARGLDPLHLREVPAKLAREAGFPQEDVPDPASSSVNEKTPRHVRKDRRGVDFIVGVTTARNGRANTKS